MEAQNVLIRYHIEKPATMSISNPSLNELYEIVPDSDTKEPNFRTIKLTIYAITK